MKKTILVFSALILALLVLFQLSSYSLASGDMRTEIVISAVAIVFFIIGVVIRRKSLKKSHSIQQGPGEIDRDKIEELGLSQREYEVLTKISEGLSNREIAERLFVSENTIKTHVSNLYIKLDARRRTQAVQKAKALNIL